MLNYSMLTPYFEDFDKTCPLKEYPRPTLVRDSYINLNGVWNYTLSDIKDINLEVKDEIVVPYVIESYLSGVRNDIDKKYICYKRNFEIKEDFIKDHIILHFGAVNQICDIYVNKVKVGSHIGGYLPFSIDITKEIKVGSNELYVIVENIPNLDLGVGKQGYKRGGMWYTKVSGIWQTVWLESYHKTAIKNIRFKTNIDNGIVNMNIDSKASEFKIIISHNNEVVKELYTKDSFVNFVIDSPKLWNTEAPNLYNVLIETKHDSIKTYFAFREVSFDEKYIYLNKEKIFLNGLLDQGYFSDGIYTPASYDAYKDDILKMKNLGFNTLRKHIKVEPEMFYYLADKLGMLVLQDFPNSGQYSFFRDTVLPTIGFKRLPDEFRKVSKNRKEYFIKDNKELLDNLYNHPSVIYYTIFNEGWGQFLSDKMYEIFKNYDPSRIYDSTSGWFYRKLTDINSLHVYFKKVRLPKKSKLPIVLSEFGGYSYKIEEHSFNSEHNYGYKLYKTKEDISNGFKELYERDVIDNIKNGLVGAIYTQVSDVEDETNGILTYDRQVLKLDENIVKEVNKKVYETFKNVGKE